MSREMLSGRIFGEKFTKEFAVFLVLGALLVGVIIASEQYVNLLVLTLPLLAIFVRRSNLWTLILISIVIFFGDWLIALGVWPHQVMWLPEALILMLLVKSASKRLRCKQPFVFPFGALFLMMLLISFSSSLINRSGIINLLLFFRLVFHYYFLYVALLNLDFNRKEKHTFIRITLALIIIQVPTAVVKMFIYGQGERAIGTYAYHGGTLSTVLPLAVIGFAFSFFVIYRHSSWFALLALGYIAFSIIGGKRGFIFFLPIVLIFLSWFLRNDIRNIFRYVLVGAFAFSLAFYFALSFVPSLSPGHHERSGFNPAFALSFATSYSQSQSAGLSWGRISSTVKMFDTLSREGFFSFCFGAGPGTAMKTRFGGYDTSTSYMDRFGIGYGITGLTWLAMNIGYLGGLLFFVFFLLLLRKSLSFFRNESHPFWRAFGLGMVVLCFVFILMNFIYAPILLSDLLNMHLFIFLAFMCHRERNRDRITEESIETV